MNYHERKREEKLVDVVMITGVIFFTACLIYGYFVAG
jgi:hypothetical protein